MNKQSITNQAQLFNARGRFLIGSFQEGVGLSFSNTPVVHGAPSEARAECARLAKLNPGKAFVFVQLCGGEQLPARPATISF